MAALYLKASQLQMEYRQVWPRSHRGCSMPVRKAKAIDLRTSRQAKRKFTRSSHRSRIDAGATFLRCLKVAAARIAWLTRDDLFRSTLSSSKSRSTSWESSQQRPERELIVSFQCYVATHRSRRVEGSQLPSVITMRTTDPPSATPPSVARTQSVQSFDLLRF